MIGVLTPWKCRCCLTRRMWCILINGAKFYLCGACDLRAG